MLLLQIYLVVTLFIPIYMDIACRVDAIMKKEFDRQMPKYYQPPTQGEGFILYIYSRLGCIEILLHAV